MATHLGLLIIAAYLIGSVPFGYIAGKLLRGIDIRKHGSGNPGATNVLRVIGKPAGISVLILDTAKGFLPVYFLAPYLADLAAKSAPDTTILPAILWQIICGLAVINGHIFTIFLKFRGGKGVATSIGVIFALSYLAGLCSLGVWALAVLVTRYVSLGSILGAISLPVWLILWTEKPFDKEAGLPLLIFGAVISVTVVIKHRGNIKRLISGTENKIGTTKKTEEA